MSLRRRSYTPIRRHATGKKRSKKITGTGRIKSNVRPMISARQKRTVRQKRRHYRDTGGMTPKRVLERGDRIGGVVSVFNVHGRFNRVGGSAIPWQLAWEGDDPDY